METERNDKKTKFFYLCFVIMHARMQLLQNINLKQTRFAVIAEVPLIFTKDEVLSKDL